MENFGNRQTPSATVPAITPETIAPGHVHVWIWQTLSTPVESDELSMLDQRELRRAERFRPALHRTRWVRSHTGMRRILAGYLSCTPAEIAFRQGPNGKPMLSSPIPLAFNLSHSEDWCALAISNGMEIGIDIQMPHAVNHALWRRVLTPNEMTQMTQLAPEEQDAAFYRCWTRKEAVGKADSRGVYVHLKRTETGLLQNDPGTAFTVTTNDESGISSAWHVTDLTLPGNLFGALATSTPAVLDLRISERIMK